VRLTQGQLDNRSPSTAPGTRAMTYRGRRRYSGRETKTIIKIHWTDGEQIYFEATDCDVVRIGRESGLG